MLNTVRKFTFFLGLIITFLLFGTSLNASHNTIYNNSPQIGIESQAEFSVSAITFLKATTYYPIDFVQAQGSSGGSQSGSSDTDVTSDLEFLGMDYSTAITVLAIILALIVAVIIILIQVSGQLNKLEEKQKHPEAEPETGFKKFIKGIVNITRPVWEFIIYKLNPVVGVLTVIGIVVVVLMFAFYNRAQDLGTQVGYAPDQPVNFSHKLHAGQYNIDCQYCHTGVRKAKSANIPSTNICMNCHNVVKEGPKYGKKEIQKIVESYNENDPIEWVRIHNLPDHVYFNHSQHVNVGNVECETCHGQVSNMEVVHQHSKLEMGWCIDCHRNRNIDEDNPYYQKSHAFVDSHSNYTVAEMGGTECQKCHY